MDEFVTRTKGLPRAAGFDEILIPGEPEARMAEQRRRTGIPISADVLRELRAEGERAGVALPDGAAREQAAGA
jgi:LDH2 family malate/lactate/ureidoglycolate dehydrogenase